MAYAAVGPRVQLRTATQAEKRHVGALKTKQRNARRQGRKNYICTAEEIPSSQFISQTTMQLQTSHNDHNCCSDWDYVDLKPNDSDVSVPALIPRNSLGLSAISVLSSCTWQRRRRCFWSWCHPLNQLALWQVW